VQSPSFLGSVSRFACVIRPIHGGTPSWKVAHPDILSEEICSPELNLILGRNTKNFPNRFVVTSFFRNFADKIGEVTTSRQKKE
jgi:hypothetical protein